MFTSSNQGKQNKFGSKKLGSSTRGIVSSQKSTSSLDNPATGLTKPFSSSSSTRSLEGKKIEGQAKRKKEAIVTAQQKIRDYQRRIEEMKEQNQAFRQEHYAKIKEYLPLSKTAAITTSYGALNKDPHPKKSLTPRQNYQISEELKKRPQVRDGLYYKMKNKKKLGASESLQPLGRDYQQVDDVFRRIQKTSARYTSGFSEQYNEMSNNDTLSSVNQPIKDVSAQEIYADDTREIIQQKFKENQVRIDSEQVLQTELESPNVPQQEESVRSNPFETQIDSKLYNDHFQSYRDFARFSAQKSGGGGTNDSRKQLKQHSTIDQILPLEFSDKVSSPPVRISKANQIQKLNYDTQNRTTESCKQQEFETLPARSLEPVIYPSSKASETSSPLKQNHTATTSTQQVEADAILMLRRAETGDSPLKDAQLADKNVISQAQEEYSSEGNKQSDQHSLGTYLRKSICSHHSNLSIHNLDNSASNTHERKWSTSGISGKIQVNQNSDKKRIDTFKTLESELKGHSQKLPLNEAQNSIFKSRQSQLHGSILSDQQQSRRPTSSNMNQDRIIQAPQSVSQAPLVFQHTSSINIQQQQQQQQQQPQQQQQQHQQYQLNSQMNQESSLNQGKSSPRVPTEPDFHFYPQHSPSSRTLQQNACTNFESIKFPDQFQASPQQIGQRPISPGFPQILENHMVKTIDQNKQQIDASTYSAYGGFMQGGGVARTQSYNPHILHHSYSSSTLNGGGIGGVSAMTNLMNQSMTNNNNPNIFDPPHSLSQSFTNSAALSPNPMTPMLGQSPSVVTLGDIEKNYVIVQYEYIVQQLNAQIKKLIERNQDYQKALQRERDGNRPQDNLIATLERKVQVLEASKAKLQQELAMNQKIQSENDLGVEEMRQEYRTQNTILENLKMQHNRGMKSQQELRERNDDLSNKLGSLEMVLQKKDQQIFQLQGEIGKLQQEFGNLSQMEQALQNELADYHSKRHNLEQAYQEQRTQLFQNQIQIRQLVNDNENYKVERGNLMHSLQMMQKNIEDVSAESNKLKKNIQVVEQEKILGAQQVDRMDRENQRFQRQVSRLSNLLQMQKGAFSNLQKDYQNAVVADERNKDNAKEAVAPVPQIFPVKQTIKPQIPQRSMSPFGRDNNNQGGITPPEPQKFSPTPTSQNLYTIPGVFSYFSTRSQSVGGRNSLPGPQQHRFMPSNAYQGVKNDQNEVINTTLPHQHAPSLSMSSDIRKSKELNLMKMQDSQGSQKHHQSDQNAQKYDEFRKRQVSSEMVGSLLNWGEEQRLRSSSAIEPFPQYLQQQQQQQQLHHQHQQQQKNNALQTSIRQYPLKKIKGNEINTHVTFPSYEKQEKEKRTIAQIEQKLQQLQLNKKKLQNEYSKIPTKVLKRGLRQRKEQLEQQLDSNDKVINHLKQKLRDLNVYTLHYSG